MRGEAAQAGRRPGRKGPAQLPPVTTCWGSGLRGREDSPRYWGQESVYFLQKKKRLEDFFKKALSFRRNLGMLLFKEKSVCNVSVTRSVLSMIYVRKWFF